MKTKECPSCAMEVENSAKICPVCGYEFPETAAGIKWVAIILIIVFLLMILLF